jgi:hypothetical protein
MHIIIMWVNVLVTIGSSKTLRQQRKNSFTRSYELVFGSVFFHASSCTVCHSSFCASNSSLRCKSLCTGILSMHHNYSCTCISSISFCASCRNFICFTMSNLGSACTTFLIFPYKWCPDNSLFYRSTPMWIPPRVTMHTLAFDLCTSPRSPCCGAPLFFPFSQ